MRGRVIGSLLLASAFVPGCEIASKTCTLVGCENGAEVTVELPAEVESLSAKLCVNVECATATLPDARAQCVTVDRPGRTEACISEPLAGKRQLRLRVTAFTPHDGDRYALTVTDMTSGEVLVDDSQSVTYTESQPNGPECEPTCHYARVTFAQR